MSGWVRIITILAAVLSISCNAPPLSFSDFSAPSRESLPSTENIVESAEDALELFDAANLSFAESQSRSAAVRVVRPFEKGHGSGTYMKMHGRYVVITAAHVAGSYTTMLIEGREGERVLGSVVYNDPEADLAVILVPTLETRSPIPFRPKKNATNLIGAKINYTGFPGRHDLLTIRGHVASLEHDMIVTNMFGWFGASGSGVFDQQGRFLGVVSGIDVGHWTVRIPLDSIVWVAPAWEFDATIVEVRVKTAPPLPGYKSFPGARAPRRGGARD